MPHVFFATLLLLASALNACGGNEGPTGNPTSVAATTSSTSNGSTGGFGGQGGSGGQTAQGTGGTASTGGGGQAQLPLEGFGDIVGSCGVLQAMDFDTQMPSLHQNNIDFKNMMFMASLLSVGGKKVHDDGNLGGSSLMSEIFAYEVLYRCELAELVKTESEIAYKDDAGKKTDLLVKLDGFSVGVSVTRAVGFPKEDPYTVAQAKDLLSDKLAGVKASTANVASGDGWKKQVLFVLAYAQGHADALKQAFGQIDASIKGDTIVWITVTDGADGFIY